MIRLINDVVDKVGGITNVILCFVLASIIESALMVLIACVFVIWCKVR